MKKAIMISIFSVCCFNLNAQDKKADEKFVQNSPEEKKEYTTKYKDEDGNFISKEKFDVLVVGKSNSMSKYPSTHEMILMIESEKELEKESEAEKTFVSRNINSHSLKFP